jgi:putative ABC transport system permease protein
VQNVAVGTAVPWRDAFDFALEFGVDGHIPAAGEEHPRAAFRVITPAFFATLGLPIIEGRDFNDGDRESSEPVAIVSQSAALRMFPKGDALNHHVMWTDPLLKFAPISPKSRRIIGVVPDMDDIHLVPRPTLTV